MDQSGNNQLLLRASQSGPPGYNGYTGQHAAADRMRELLARTVQDHIVEERTTAAALQDIRQRLNDLDDASALLRFEVVVHEASERVLKAFEAYATTHGGTALMDRRRDVRGLAFIPVRAPSSKVQRIAAFSFVRVLRGMPSLRPFRPGILRNRGGFAVLP